MCVFLFCEDFGNTHIYQLPIGKWKIPQYLEFLTRLHLIKQDFYCIFGVIRCLYFVLISHQVSGRYLDIPNIESFHQFNKRLVCIPHHHIFLPLDTLVVDGYYGNFIQGTVHVFD